MAELGRIGLVGGGNMGSALLKGLLSSGTAGAEAIWVAELDQGRRRELAQELGVKTVASPAELKEISLLILAVKPGDIPAAARQAAGGLAPGALVITLAAGVRIETVAKELPPDQPVVRAMPNTPALIGQGATALAAGPQAGPQHLELAERIFRAVGRVAIVPEKLMDAVTGLSGSGPAYVFLFIESLADAGVAQGLDRATALELAAQTVAGAAALLLERDEHPARLKDMVTSPGGTTIAGLHALERGGFKGLVMDAVAAATRRGQELGK